MVENPVTKAHAPLNFAHLRSHVPELDLTHVAYRTVQFDPPLDSSNVSPEHWSRIAHIIADSYEMYDGFVVLHGTDTMAYSASALSYMLENLNKPVVFTGSQLPVGVLRTDGKENLITAVEIAAAKDRIGRAMVPEVCIYFQSSLMRGNRAKKINAERFNAFSSPNFPEIAQIGVHINYAHHYIHHTPAGVPLKPHFQMSTDVVMLMLFPGISRDVVEGILHIPGLRGVVMETFGTGNAMTADWFVTALKQAIERGIVIVNVTQCVGGAVEMSRYDAGNCMAQVGVIGSGDMTTEATVTKLMFLLGQGLSQHEVETKMLEPLAGEMTVSTANIPWKSEPQY
jgi:L-asparaginase